ncbi:hypothetical protein HK099_004394 [Clydaea vesicula]|uniref:CID domain-containing protein n=1 Tax=Clydaea vesicula TaxID=447962 RepID=A0AAD5XVM8_9FUNG|nr:hypothetical protein HK099_004394 [Clydaea vesicula]KAJ3380173.1 hypothetical protein HDU92_006143 [Lobulomyces angularis]
MDGFQIRIEFKELLSKLTVRPESILKTAQFAIDYKSFHENLFDCIFEHVHTSNVLERLNLLYVLDRMVSMSNKTKFQGYLDLVSQNLIDIVDNIVPNNSTGLININGLKKVLKKWKVVLKDSSEKFEEIDKKLELMEQNDNNNHNNDNMNENNKIKPDHQHHSLQQKRKHSKVNNVEKMTDDVIMKRIEDDRERHKRIKEEFWLTFRKQPELVFDRDFESDPEFNDCWENFSDLNENDKILLENESLKYKDIMKT